MIAQTQFSRCFVCIHVHLCVSVRMCMHINYMHIYYVKMILANVYPLIKLVHSLTVDS